MTRAVAFAHREATKTAMVRGKLHHRRFPDASAFAHSEAYATTTDTVTGYTSRVKASLGNPEGRTQVLRYSVAATALSSDPTRADTLEIDAGFPGAGNYNITNATNNYGVWQLDLEGPTLSSTLDVNAALVTWSSLVLNAGSGTFTFDGTSSETCIYNLRYRNPPTHGQWFSLAGATGVLNNSYSGQPGPAGLAAGTYEVEIQGRDAVAANVGRWGDFHPMGTVVVT